MWIPVRIPSNDEYMRQIVMNYGTGVTQLPHVLDPISSNLSVAESIKGRIQVQQIFGTPKESQSGLA